MTNKVETIIAAIEAKLILGGIKATIRFPEQLSSVGNRYPLAIIKEESKDFILTSGQRYEYTLNISITLVSDQLRERMKYMNNLEVAVFNQLFPDCTLGGLVHNLNPVSVNMGDLIIGSDLNAYAGFTETNSFRTITLECMVTDTRI
jgi:hypothetical protein